MRTVLGIAAAIAGGLLLLSCSRPRAPVVSEPLPPAAGYAPSASVDRTQLPPPEGYVPPDSPSYAPRSPSVAYLPPPARPYRNPTYAPTQPETGSRMVWRSTPRWAAVKEKPRAKAPRPAPKVAAKPDPEAKFKAAQAKAAEVGVENLSQEDIDGLSLAEIKELRGY